MDTKKPSAEDAFCTFKKDPLAWDDPDLASERAAFCEGWADAHEWEQRAKHAEAALSDLQARVNAKYDEVVAARVIRHVMPPVAAPVGADFVRQLVYSKCGTNRINEPCGSPSNCALIGLAHAVALEPEQSQPTGTATGGHDAAFQDAIHRGTGMVRQHPDGSVEHIPYGQWRSDTEGKS
jgi:hypothetical protein